MQPPEDEAKIAGHAPPAPEPATDRPAAQPSEPGESKLGHGTLRGRAEGRSPDRVEGLRAAVLLFARSRLAPLSAEDAAAIAALADERELTELVDTLAQATSVEEARAVLAAAIAGMRA
jgi:hypothetical protein